MASATHSKSQAEMMFSSAAAGRLSATVDFTGLTQQGSLSLVQSALCFSHLLGNSSNTVQREPLGITDS